MGIQHLHRGGFQDHLLKNPFPVLLLSVACAYGQASFTFDIASYQQVAVPSCTTGTNNVQWLPTSSVVTWYDTGGNTHNGETQTIFNTNPVCKVLRLDMNDVDWTNHNVNTLTNLRRFDGVASDGGSNWVFDLSNLYVLTNANIYYHTNLYLITITGCTNLQDVNFSANRTLTNIEPSTTAFLRFTNLIANDCSNLLASSQEKLSLALSNMVAAVARSNGTVNFQYCPAITTAGENALLFLSNYAWTVSYSTSTAVGTNGVLWWTNDVGVGTSIVDPVAVDLSLETVYSMAARNCTNLQSLIGGGTGTVTNFTYNGLGALTNFSVALNVSSNEIDNISKVIVDNGSSNATFGVVADPSSTGITNFVILRDRGYNVSFQNVDNKIFFGPINTYYLMNNDSNVFVGDIYDMAQSNIYNISPGSSTRNYLGPLDNTSVTQAIFFEEKFNQGAVDNVLAGINNNGQLNGVLDLRFTATPTDGYTNGDYQSLTNNGWTVLITLPTIVFDRSAYGNGTYGGVSFGDVLTNTLGMQITVNVTNIGTAPLTVTNIYSPGSDWILDTSAFTFPQQMAGWTSLPLYITFNPNSLGLTESNVCYAVSDSTDGVDSTNYVILNGRGVYCDLGGFGSSCMNCDEGAYTTNINWSLLDYCGSDPYGLTVIEITYDNGGGETFWKNVNFPPLNTPVNEDASGLSVGSGVTLYYYAHDICGGTALIDFCNYVDP